MAFKKVESSLQKAVLLDKQNPTITGYFLGVEKPKKTKFKKSVILVFQNETGEKLTVWGSASVNLILLDSAGNPNPALVGRLVRLTYTGSRKVKKGQNPMKEITVEVDADRTIKPGKAYQLDASKTFKK